jgi:chlorite dismutase
MPAPLLVHFLGVPTGPYRVLAQRAVAGTGLPLTEAVSVQEGAPPIAAKSSWCLRGVTSHQRYTQRHEADGLRSAQAGLGRPEATHAALIPIKKSAAWWELAQDERRAIFEDRSRHIADTLQYLPAIARRLHHARDLAEPFDFVTWFEFAPQHASAFDELLGKLRASEEWQYVEREVEVRLVRSADQVTATTT